MGSLLGGQVDLRVELVGLDTEGRLLLGSVTGPGTQPSSPGQSDSLWVLISRLAHESASA